MGAPREPTQPADTRLRRAPRGAGTGSLLHRRPARPADAGLRLHRAELEAGLGFPGTGNAVGLEIRWSPTGRWCGAWLGGADGGGAGGVRCAPGRGGWRRPAGTGRRSRAAAPSSSAPPSRPSRPPNPRTARTRSTVLRDQDHRRAVLDRRVPRAYPVFVADPDRVHHDDPPSHTGAVAVSVSLRHQRSSATTQRPAPASRRSATGRTRSPLQTTALCPPG
jgi:hypothetical protein